MFWQVFTISDDEAGCTLLGYLQGKVVGIEVLTFEGKENGILFYLAAIGGYLVGFEIMLVYSFNHGLYGFGSFDRLRDPWIFNERSRLIGSNGFNTIMKRNY